VGPRPSERGFTLIELVVVVIIIAVFSALAIPAVTHQLRDRRVHEAAERIQLVYQQARMHAMGEGGAVMVRFSDTASPQGRFDVLEALVGTTDKKQNCAILPSSSCTLTDWNNTALGQFRTYDSLDLGSEFGLDSVLAELHPDANSPTASKDTMDVCFTPLGRTYVRYVPTTDTPLLPLTGVPSIDVTRAYGGNKQGLTRTVLVLPSGIARLQL
jgi:prepilin-type N-terminal cleavage/methylation domain-containing protein